MNQNKVCTIVRLIFLEQLNDRETIFLLMSYITTNAEVQNSYYLAIRIIKLTTQEKDFQRINYPLKAVLEQRNQDQLL